jgi:hypothetical protein
MIDGDTQENQVSLIYSQSATSTIVDLDVIRYVRAFMIKTPRALISSPKFYEPHRQRVMR